MRTHVVEQMAWYDMIALYIIVGNLHNTGNFGDSLCGWEGMNKCCISSVRHRTWLLFHRDCTQLQFSISRNSRTDQVTMYSWSILSVRNSITPTSQLIVVSRLDCIIPTNLGAAQIPLWRSHLYNLGNLTCYECSLHTSFVSYTNHSDIICSNSRCYSIGIQASFHLGIHLFIMPLSFSFPAKVSILPSSFSEPRSRNLSFPLAHSSRKKERRSAKYCLDDSILLLSRSWRCDRWPLVIRFWKGSIHSSMPTFHIWRLLYHWLIFSAIAFPVLAHATLAAVVVYINQQITSNFSLPSSIVWESE